MEFLRSEKHYAEFIHNDVEFKIIEKISCYSRNFDHSARLFQLFRLPSMGGKIFFVDYKDFRTPAVCSPMNTMSDVAKLAKVEGTVCQNRKSKKKPKRICIVVENNDQKNIAKRYDYHTYYDERLKHAQLFKDYTQDYGDISEGHQHFTDTPARPVLTKFVSTRRNDKTRGRLTNTNNDKPSERGLLAYKRIVDIVDCTMQWLKALSYFAARVASSILNKASMPEDGGP
uniref:Uncharacterized protein n=1 Tax=Romanomermis culicivorax TaxID=13658 RepID=A0A915HLF0_ROMCU